jgi:glycosyltransferase involved in cell wall biosynthesis
VDLSDVSVIIICYNEERNIRRCLEGLDGFGEIVVVDSFSTDQTVSIAREFPVVIYQRPFVSAAKQKNWAISIVKNDWILILDSDEALTPELKMEIAQLNPGQQIQGYWLRRRSQYLGRKIRHCGWQRDKVLRLFHKPAGRYDETEVHEEISLGGQAGIMIHFLDHYPYSGLDQHLKKINDYTSRGAHDYIDRGGRFPIANSILHPPFRFIRMYIVQAGFLDGLPGFVLCLLSTYGVFLKYAKAWELRRRR